MTKSSRDRVFVLNDPHAMRISGDLAAEIGLNESIVLLQLEFLLSVYGRDRKGRLWTRQSLAELREEYFHWWSLATVHRAVRSLEEQGLLTVENYNRTGFDRTQWFSLNLDGLARLSSIQIAGAQTALPLASLEVASISQDEKSISQDEKSISANREIDVRNMRNRSSQNEKSLRKETSEETSEENMPARPASERRQQQDRIWDTLSQIFGEPETRTAKRLLGRVVQELLEVNATPAEITKRVRQFGYRFPGASCTATALVKHWSNLQPPKAVAADPTSEIGFCEHNMSLKARCEECEAAKLVGASA